MDSTIEGIIITRRSHRGIELGADYSTTGDRPLQLGGAHTGCRCKHAAGIHVSPTFGRDRHVPDELHALTALLQALADPDMKQVAQMENYLRENELPAAPDWRERVTNTIAYIRDRAAAHAAA